MMPAKQTRSSGRAGSSLPDFNETAKGRQVGKVREVLTMSDGQFARLSEYIRTACGIKLPPAKKTMLEGRLRKRLHALGIESFDRYCEHLFSSHGSESEYIHMIDVVTTNKTDFFREPDHFDYLSETVLPELVSAHGPGVRNRLIVWSAGCSTGEEPYTLAMVLSEFAEQCPGFRFSILATDISTAVLEKAKSGIYEHEKVAPIPMMFRKKYLLKSKDRDKGLVRIAPELRAAVRFERLNFMEEDYEIAESIGVVFCRNVIIYFDRLTQEQFLKRISQYLMPGGYLFVGHSESLHSMDLPLVQTATTVYRKLPSDPSQTG
jgi:chemotaxis protein methyltransferase CheR